MGKKRGRERYWVHSNPNAGDDEPQRPCARGRWCAEAAVVIDDGAQVFTPKLGYRTFCETDRDRIGQHLAELPGLYVELAVALGQPGQGIAGGGKRGKPEPRLPIRIDLEAQQRLIAFILAGWQERVQIAISLAPAAKERVRPGYAVDRAAATLSAHLDTLLGLEPAPMARTVPLAYVRTPRANPRPDTAPEWVRAGADGSVMVPQVWDDREFESVIGLGVDYAVVTARIGGATAGAEILDLHHKTRQRLNLTRPHLARLPGVPCRVEQCDQLRLRRTEPPQHDSDVAYWSECGACGDRMTREEYDVWTKRYEAYLRGAGKSEQVTR